MKKSTAIIIFRVYLASIVLIGFFGMSVKVYDIQKYVKEIEMSVEAEDSSMFKFEDLGKDSSKNNKYKLTIYFSQAILDTNEKECIPLNLIPKVTYKTGDVNAKGESIKYSLNPEGEELENSGYFSLDDLGRLMVYQKRISFDIYINPESVSGIGSGAVINVYVR